jgi:5-hydroxyisourate hydrolase-like protein (transthyretin family)
VRVELLTPRVETEPGASCQVELEVFNTGEVIDSVTSRVGYPFDGVQSPSTLSLFPESGGPLTVSFRVPDDFAAGSHLVPIEVASTFQHDDVAVANLQLEVAPVVSAKLGLTPSDITAGKKAKFAVDVTNTGNVPLDLTLTGNDLERVLRFRFEPLFLHVEPGETVHASGLAVGKRPFFGSPVSRSLTVLAWGTNIDLSTAGRFVQKPRIPKGFLTFLALAAVILIWAAVIIAGASLVLAKDSVKKTVPETFLVGNAGFDPAVVAGSVSGVVTANDGSPVGRITVEAWRVPEKGPSKLMGSAATTDDGKWELATVKPGTYHLRFTAPNFKELWYPNASSEAGAQDVRVRPVAATADLATTIVGEDGSIEGAVIAGEQAEINAQIIVKEYVDDAPGDIVGEPVATDPVTGQYRIGGLATPASYQLTILMNGFDDQTFVVTLGGGEDQVVNTVNMAAAPGTLSGTVVGSSGGDSIPLGGVAVTLTGSGQSLAGTTPTDGEVGTWLFTDLPTPGTYLLTFALEGYGTQTIAVDLRAGQARDGVIVELLEGTGRVEGVATNVDGSGGVTVTVTGAPEPLSTMSLTTGDVGAYVINGLPTPGHYTLTFSMDGFSPVTVGVDLDSGGSATGVDAVLERSTSSIIGTIEAGGSPVAGASVTVSDGQQVRATVTADDPAGGYRFDALPAGRYTLTITFDGYRSRTVLVDVARGATETVDASLTADA